MQVYELLQEPSYGDVPRWTVCKMTEPYWMHKVGSCRLSEYKCSLIPRVVRICKFHSTLRTRIQSILYSLITWRTSQKTTLWRLISLSRQHIVSIFLQGVIRYQWKDYNIRPVIALLILILEAKLTLTSLSGDVYPSIEPTLASNSQAGKVIVITGASRGMGRTVRAITQK